MEGDPRTLEQVGLAEGITPERVRQIVLRADTRLRFFIERDLTDLVPVRSAVATNAETEMENGPALI